MFSKYVIFRKKYNNPPFPPYPSSWEIPGGKRKKKPKYRSQHFYFQYIYKLN